MEMENTTRFGMKSRKNVPEGIAFRHKENRNSAENREQKACGNSGADDAGHVRAHGVH